VCWDTRAFHALISAFLPRISSSRISFPARFTACFRTWSARVCLGRPWRLLPCVSFNSTVPGAKTLSRNASLARVAMLQKSFSCCFNSLELSGMTPACRRTVAFETWLINDAGILSILRMHLVRNPSNLRLPAGPAILFSIHTSGR
jgi:hypothetical protein